MARACLGRWLKAGRLRFRRNLVVGVVGRLRGFRAHIANGKLREMPILQCEAIVRQEISMRCVQRRTIVLIVSALLGLLSSNLHAQSEKRVALVIGNGAYKNAPLLNPTNDARDISARLRQLGFEVVQRDNLTSRQIGSALREFRSHLQPGAVALVFYAGHGLQIKGDNYLPAVDAEIDTEEDVPNQSLSVKQVLDVLDDAKTRLNLVFLDACRNNPYARSFRSTGSGLTKVNSPSGTLISFATRPGSVASDGNGKNGLYTEQLLLAMENLDMPIELALKRVVAGVKARSAGKQEPWMEGSIEGDFCFGRCGQGSPPAAPASAPGFVAPAPSPALFEKKLVISAPSPVDAPTSASTPKGAIESERARCSMLLNKAALGENISVAEKKELIQSCR